jgi:hypothetical protein
VVLAVVTGVLAPQAFAAPSATLDGEQLAHVTAADVQARCDYGYLRAALSYGGSGTAKGPYAGTFTARGTALLYMAAPPSLFALDATFEIVTPAGTTKGTLERVDGPNSGTGSCNVAAGYTTGERHRLLGDARRRRDRPGVVELSISNDPANARFTATFHSTSRVADMDLDGVFDGADNCPTSANATQSDVDDDGAGDACDIVDNRSDLFDDLVASSRAAGLPEDRLPASRACALGLLLRRRHRRVHRARVVHRRCQEDEGTRSRDGGRARREGGTDPDARRLPLSLGPVPIGHVQGLTLDVAARTGAYLLTLTTVYVVLGVGGVVNRALTA